MMNNTAIDTAAANTTVNPLEAALAQAKASLPKDAPAPTEQVKRRPGRPKKKSTEAKEKKIPHLGRVKEAEKELQPLPNDAKEAIEAGQMMDLSSLSVMIQHLEHNCNLEVGQTVRVTAGPAHNLGLEGVVTTVSRIRAHVNVEGRERDVYCFRSDLTVLPQEEEAEVEEAEVEEEEITAEKETEENTES
jgi:acylphosphatase